MHVGGRDRAVGEEIGLDPGADRVADRGESRHAGSIAARDRMPERKGIVVEGVAVRFRAGLDDPDQPVDGPLRLGAIPQIPDHVGVDDAADVVVGRVLTPPKNDPALPGEVAEHRPPVDRIERGDGAEDLVGVEAPVAIAVVEHEGAIVGKGDAVVPEDRRDAGHVVEIGGDEGMGLPSALHRALVPIAPQAVAVHLAEEVFDAPRRHRRHGGVGNRRQGVEDRRRGERRMILLHRPAGAVAPRPFDGKLPRGELAADEEVHAGANGWGKLGFVRRGWHRGDL